jgi:uncharacterized protein YaaR (DUF327 family)
MKINRINDKTSVHEKKPREKVEKTMDFSTTLDMANKDQSEQNLKQMLKEIDNLGKKLASTRSVEDAKLYRNKIQEYINYIVKNAYVLRREPGPFNYGVHVRIEIINKKLDELTKNVIEEQQGNIELATKIEEIRGLLVDVYK